MTTYLYLSLTPESLVVSHLEAEEFGKYLAVGTRNLSSGAAMFFELDPALAGGYGLMREAAGRCLPHRDGSPRRSTYLAIYRVLEQVPLAAIGRLHLVTSDGRVLSLDAAAARPTGDHCFHLYQEFCPVSPRVVSSLGPEEFCARMTDAAQPVWVPQLAFAELTLGALATDLDSEEVGDLPYPNLPHLRDCLRELRSKPGKPTKVVVRHVRDDIIFRTLQGGLYVGRGRDLKFFPMPSPEELDTEHHEWWRSAQRSYGS
jgi:hypothetical protein